MSNSVDQKTEEVIGNLHNQLSKIEKDNILLKQQTAELQQEVDRLKLALEQCKGLTTWGTEDATHVFNQIDKIASKAINPQQDEKTGN